MRLLRTSGGSIPQLASELGVSPQSLRNWMAAPETHACGTLAPRYCTGSRTRRDPIVAGPERSELVGELVVGGMVARERGNRAADRGQQRRRVEALVRGRALPAHGRVQCSGRRVGGDREPARDLVAAGSAGTDRTQRGSAEEPAVCPLVRVVSSVLGHGKAPSSRDSSRSYYDVSMVTRFKPRMG